MENKETKTVSIWTAIKLFFANDIENSEEFKKELEEIENVQKQVHAERKEFGASIRVKPSKGKSIKREKNREEKELGE